MTILGSKRGLFGVVLFLGLLAMTSRSITDPDLWWHLRTGQWAVENGRVPHTDPFSFTRGGSPWVSHEWLSEIIFFELWKRGGPGALIAFSAVITTAGFLLLYWRCPGRPQWAAALTALGATASALSWGARPQMFTFTLASLLLWLLERGEKHSRIVLLVPPLFLLWLNLHAGFALALALLLLYGLGLALECVSGSEPWEKSGPTIARVFAVTLACFALVPLNPSGAQLYRYPLETLFSGGMRDVIMEWFSPNFHQWLMVPLLLVFLILIVAMARSRPRVKGRTLLPLLFTAGAALDAVRHIPIFILLAIPVVAAALAPTSEAPLLMRRRPVSRSAAAIINGAALILLSAFAVGRWIELARQQPVQEAAHFPRAAVAFLQSHEEGERLFAYYDWGGYAIWELYPRYRVFADGRADLYGDELLRECSQTVPQIRAGWEQVLQSWDVQTVMIPPSTALAQALMIHGGWSQAYRDQQAAIFVRVRAKPDKAEVIEDGSRAKKCILVHPDSAKLMITHWNGSSVAGVEWVGPRR